MNNPIKLVVVGMGEIGLLRSITAKALNDIELKCVVDSNILKARIAGKQLKAPYYTSLKEAIKREDVNAVLISTPAKSHFSLIKEAIETGKHVFCEKPMCTTHEESIEIKRLVEQTNLIHNMGYNFRFHPSYKRAHEIISNNALGQIYYIKTVGHKSETIEPESTEDRKDRLERFGIYGAFAVHAIDLMFCYAESDVDFLRSVTSRLYSSELDDVIVGCGKFKNSITFVFDFSWSHHGIDGYYISLLATGTNGTLIVDEDHIELNLKEGVDELHAGHTTIFNSEICCPVGFELGGKDLCADLQVFAKAIKENKLIHPTLIDGYKVDQFIHLINQSSKDEGSQKVILSEISDKNLQKKSLIKKLKDLVFK